MTTMAPTRSKVRFNLSAKRGEETGALIWIVEDSLTGRIRLITNDLDEANQLCGALNDGAHLLVHAITEECRYIPGVEYGEAE